MSVLLFRSTGFDRAARRYLKKNPAAAADLEIALTRLADDPTHPALRTHRLQGPLEGSLACSAGYDLRIVFRLVRHEGKEAVLLQTVGTHDEVY
jgi:mRNA-degrading endonuclease YafQ of YafQ-DinJ toxin-antitoxin module